MNQRLSINSVSTSKITDEVRAGCRLVYQELVEMGVGDWAVLLYIQYQGVG